MPGQVVRTLSERLPRIEDDRVREAVGPHEAARVTPRVPAVDSQEDDALGAIALPERLESGRLPLARGTPGGEEVEHDGLPAERGERHVTGAGQAVERERRRRRADLRRRRLVRQVPPEHGREDPDAHHGERLCPELQRGDHDRMLGRDDEHRRPDSHAVEQPLCRWDLHPDAAVRLRVSDRPGLVGAVDPHARARSAPSSACRAGCRGRAGPASLPRPTSPGSAGTTTGSSA